MNKAILINPSAKGDDFVTEVEYNDFRDIQDMLQVRAFTSFPLGSDTGFCDDEGLLTLSPSDMLVDFGTIYEQPIVGRVLIVGPPDAEGESLPPTKTVEYYRERVRPLPYGRFILRATLGML